MKKMKILSALLAVIILVIISGSVGAYMRKQTGTVENTFIPAEVSCEVVETFDNNLKTDISIKNTGTVDAYLRLSFVTYWVDKNGDIIMKEPKELSFEYDSSKWFELKGIYYYKDPVMPGESTADLLEEGKSIGLYTEGTGDNVTRQVIEVFAEAIQSIPSDAVTEAWDVNVNANKQLTIN